MIKGAILRGLDAMSIDIEVALSPGAGFDIVGLARDAVRESGVRLAHAIEASGCPWPEAAITVNLAPADIPKTEASLDLALALAILEAAGQISNKFQDPVYVVGELGLDGRVRPCKGALSMGRMVPDGSVLIAPHGNRYELALLRGLKDVQKDFDPLVVDRLATAIRVLSGKIRPLAKAKAEDFKAAFGRGPDFKDVKGQERAKRALEVAATGGHNVLLLGPPGEGKSLLSKALPTILPRLRASEILELTQIYSAKGELPSGNHVVAYRPYRPVHHTASTVAIVGGGSGFPVPGELTLAHRGVLFFDELPEFGRRLLETLRQPLEDGEIHLTRRDGAATYPCQVILVAAMNPCPCGYEGEFICDTCDTRIPYGDTNCPKCKSTERRPRCKCTPSEIARYRKRVSGPILDRIDLTVRVSPLTGEERFSQERGESSRDIRARVETARQLQEDRFRGTDIPTNAHIPGGQVDRYCQLHASALAAMKKVADRIPEITTRGHDKLLKVSRTVADLNNSTQIYKKHVTEAADLCGHERVKEFLMLQPDLDVCRSCGASVEIGDSFCRACGNRL